MSDRKPRGELAELSNSLQSLCVAGKRSERELKLAKREVFKKVINYMTLGMDMSSLFPMMISCANLSSDDIVLKKMLYLYITHYATQTPDLALLTINQMHKDCQDQDPTVRGLALRSLCSLRLANLLEYVLAPVTTGLDDRHEYVRRTAVMGVLKAWHLDQITVTNQGMLDKVRQMLWNDPDPQVIGNCLSVLTQVEGAEKLINKPLVYHCLNRLKDFSDWSQCYVLELTAHYKPASQEEVFDVLNVLEDRLAAGNSAVVLAAAKVFLHLTLEMFATHQQVLERIKDPLKTLISRDDPAVVYAVLSHVLLIVRRAPIIFENDYVSFYCRTHDPSYIKTLKMQILTAIVTSTNVFEIVSELTEYARDISPQMAREAVKAVGRIALAIPEVNGILERLLLFLESGSDHIVAETLVQMVDLLRRYPDLADACLHMLGDMQPALLEEPTAKAALIWIFGQHGAQIKAAPYLLEPLARSFSEEAPEVRLSLLTAAMKLFFQRPPEARPLLGATLAAGVNDSNQDVHDRALMYYRLLRQDVNETQRIVAPPCEPTGIFSESMSPDVQDKVFAEFNTLAVIYNAPSSTFVRKQAYHQHGEEETDGEDDSSPDEPVDSTSGLLQQSQVEADLLDLDLDAPGPSPQQTAAAGTGGGITLDSLLDLDTLPTPSTSASAAPTQPQLTLNAQAKISPQAFQERWRTLPAAHQYTDNVSPATISAMAAGGHKDFCQHMTQAYIMTMASGGNPPMFRYYFYAQTADLSSLMLTEMIVHTDSGSAQVTVKVEDSALLQQYLELWQMCLAGFYR